MKIAVASNGADLSAQSSPIFGRCPLYIMVDTETMAFELIENPAMGAPGGTGIQAAQFVIEKGAQAVIAGSTGPNAYQVFQSAKIPVYLFSGGTVRDAIEAFKAGNLQATGSANAPAHAGMSIGQTRGSGAGMGRGMDMGRGMGRGMGMGQGMGMPTSTTPSPVRNQEISNLQEIAGSLRQQLAEVMERLDKLEKGE